MRWRLEATPGRRGHYTVTPMTVAVTGWNVCPSASHSVAPPSSRDRPRQSSVSAEVTSSGRHYTTPTIRPGRCSSRPTCAPASRRLLPVRLESVAGRTSLSAAGLPSRRCLARVPSRQRGTTMSGAGAGPGDRAVAVFWSLSGTGTTASRRHRPQRRQWRLLVGPRRTRRGPGQVRWGPGDETWSPARRRRHAVTNTRCRWRRRRLASVPVRHCHCRWPLGSRYKAPQPVAVQRRVLPASWRQCCRHCLRRHSRRNCTRSRWRWSRTCRLLGPWCCRRLSPARRRPSSETRLTDAACCEVTLVSCGNCKFPKTILKVYSLAFNVVTLYNVDIRTTSVLEIGLYIKYKSIIMITTITLRGTLLYSVLLINNELL